MKIWVFSSLFPPAGGGLERIAFNIALEQSKAGHVVIAFTSDLGNKKSSTKVINQNFTHIKLPSFASPLGGPFPHRFLFECYHFAKKYGRPNIIHIHYPIGGFPEAGAILSLLMRIPLVFNIHLEVVGTTWRKYLLPIHYLTIFRFLLKQSSYILSANIETIRRVFYLSKYSKQSVKIIPNGINQDIFYPGRNNETSRIINKEIRRIVFIGRLNIQKRIDRLLVALKQIRDSNKDFKIHLDIFGDGEEREKLKDLCSKCKINNIVAFHGQVSHEQIGEILRNGDYWYSILPSDFECFPLSVIESMRCGVPVLSSKIVQLKKAFGDNIGYFRIKREEMAIDIMKYLNNPDIRENLRSKSLKYSENLSWEKISHQIIELYGYVITPNNHF
ncbi:MAG: glycosyltransferase family 4 protein [Promethearchaeota archaeon]